MIRISVLYPAGDDVTFDVDYYKTNHRDLCFKILGCEQMEVDTADHRAVRRRRPPVLPVDGGLPGRHGPSRCRPSCRTT